MINKIFTLSILMLTIGMAQSFDHQHTLLNDVLKKHVKDFGGYSQVNYKLLKKEPESLNDYVKSVSLVEKKSYEQWTQDQQLSFLINVYNAYTLSWIVQHYPVKSIKDTGSLFSSPWKKKFFKLFGHETSLDNVEHDMIRKWFKEPRIHFAVNCASIGCPKLLAAAFQATQLNKQLEEATKSFVNDKTRNTYKNKELKLSKIFKWYGGDFKSKGGVAKFVSKYLAGLDDKQRKNAAQAKISYFDYDWALNETKD